MVTARTAESTTMAMAMVILIHHPQQQHELLEKSNQPPNKLSNLCPIKYTTLPPLLP
jgi:hypothetical protein